MEIFQYDYMLRAMAIGLMLGIVIPSMGVIIVNRRLAMIGDALSHVSLAGVMSVSYTHLTLPTILLV